MSDIKTNITINVVEPGSSTPVVPNTSTIESISTPDTGLFTSGIGAKEATIIGIVAFIVLVAIASAIIHYHNKKHGKITKLTRLLAKYRNTVRSKKKLSIPLASLALVVSLGTFASLVKTGVNAEEANNTEAQDNTSLTIGISSPDLTIEVADEPVFAILPVELTVEEATRAGYTLTAYADSTDIVSTTNPNNIIPMVTVDSEEDLVSLTNNTYGISLSEPTSRGDKVYTTLSANQNTPTILKTIDDYSPTEAEDKTTIYYGFYITPDVPKGTYESSSIYYEAEPNHITTLSFNGNDNDGGEEMEDITIPAGNTITLPDNTYTKDGYHFTGWNTQADGEGEPYAAGAEFTATQGETKDITLYAQWEEDGPTIGDLTYMQDFASLNEADKASILNSMAEGEQYQLKDNRDQKDYYISKLADGNVWMTQNLDLCIGCGDTAALTSQNTDLNRLYNDGYSNNDGMISWASSRDTLFEEGGDTYVYPSDSTDDDIVYDSFANCTDDNHSRDECLHHHVGNYYDWETAAAISDFTRGETAENSICPTGWRLPSRGSAFTNLIYASGIIANSSDKSYTAEGFNKLRNSPIYFVRAGSYQWGGHSFSLSNRSQVGYYWSDRSYYSYDYPYSVNEGYNVSFSNSYVKESSMDKGNKSPVRCVLR